MIDYTARRARAADALTEGGLGESVVLVGAGDPIAVPGGLDRVHPFETHPHYFWLTGGIAAGGVVAWDPGEGRVDGWAWFEPPVSLGERIWEGVRGDREGTPLTELAGWLAARRGREVVALGGAIPGTVPSERAQSLDVSLLHARRGKDSFEVGAIREAARITALGHAVARELIASGGVTERAVGLAIDHAFREAGGDGPGYDTIVGAGENAAVLHFSPGAREVGRGKGVLIDAGASKGRYTADVSRVYPCGALGEGARALISVVEGVQAEAVAGCVAGVEFNDLHDRAVLRLLGGLGEMGLVKGRPEDLFEAGLGRVFMPHGLGHLVGLGVRDATGRQPGRDHRVSRSGTRVRLDAVLEAGWVVTVEPGCYFIPGLLEPADDEFLDWPAVESLMREISGVRIEDDVLVTPRGPENLTASIPKLG